MHIGTPARFARSALTGLALVGLAGIAPLAAQQGAGEGFLFRPPPGTLTLYGGYAAPFARGGVFDLTTENLTVDRADFRSGSFGMDLSFTVRPRAELVFGFQRATSRTPSEFRDWVDNNNAPIEQVTRLQTMPLTASVRWYLKDRGRRIGTVAWVPATFVPYVSAGGGVVNYRFEQFGDFVDTTTLNIFPAQLRTSGWSAAAQLGAGAQWNLNQRWLVTGELRYLHARGKPDEFGSDFSGYDVNLSGVSTLVGITVRF